MKTLLFDSFGGILNFKVWWTLLVDYFIIFDIYAAQIETGAFISICTYLGTFWSLNWPFLL